MNTFVIGDIHGGHRALLQCLTRSHFDYDNDTLICLGDVADGWPDVVECFEELLKIKHLIFVRGNHDDWLLNYLRTEEAPQLWLRQGGVASFKSYNRQPSFKETHKVFLQTTPFYHVDKYNNLYVHGGVDRLKHPVTTDPEELMWSRELWYGSMKDQIWIPAFKNVYIGHTSVYRFSTVPVETGNLVFMDTGGGFEGVLSMMNVNSRQVFQSDLVSALYPEIIIN